MKQIFNIIAIVLVIDIMGFFSWILLSQNPTDGFFIGAITRSILQAIF